VVADLPADSTAHTDSPRAGKRYEYKVVAVNEAGKSARSNIASVQA
jgi:hypothetical protein